MESTSHRVKSVGKENLGVSEKSNDRRDKRIGLLEVNQMSCPGNGLQQCSREQMLNERRVAVAQEIRLFSSNEKRWLLKRLLCFNTLEKPVIIFGDFLEADFPMKAALLRALEILQEELPG